MTEPKEQKNRLSSSFKVGAIALIFLIIGYNAALFVFKASSTAIISHRDHPDTVYIVKYPEKVIEGTNTSIQDHEADIQTEQIFRKNAAHAPQASSIHEKYSRKAPESFKFNPNTVSVEDLQRLGFSEKQALSIDRYRQNGGHFRRAGDFGKSFVVSDSVFKRLESYIDIPLLDINSADSAGFDSLPGIGPYFAAKIVDYRSRLGGFSFKEQLMDIRNFDIDKYNELEDLIYVGPCEPYPLWTVSEDSLKSHPYITPYGAHGVVLFRENTPKSELTVENLAAAGILKEGNAEKLKRCRISPAE